VNQFDSWFVAGSHRWLLYGFLFALALWSRLACFTGLIGSDDLMYIYYARQLAAGIYSPGLYHVPFRWGVFAPVALIYRVWGATEYSSVLIPILASAASPVLLTAIGARLFHPRAGLIGGLLLLSFPVHLNYASILVPEPVMEFLLLVGAWLYVVAAQKDRPLYALAAGLAFGCAYLTKEPALFVALAFLVDAAWHRRWRILLPLGGALFAVGAAELLFYRVIAGDMFLRLHAVSRSQLDYAEAYPELFIYRRWKDYPRFMLTPNVYLGLHSLIALVGTLYALFVLLRFRRSLLLLLWSALPFLYLAFGTVDFHRLLAPPGAPRYLSLIYPPLFLLTGLTLASPLSGSPRTKHLASVVMILVLAVGLWCGFSMRAQGGWTAAVAVLRRIADRVRSDNLSIVEVQGPDRPRWSCAMLTLLGSRPQTANCVRGCMTIYPDDIGLPATRSSSGAGSTDPTQPPLQCYPWGQALRLQAGAVTGGQ
jgi:hypothetical protein